MKDQKLPTDSIEGSCPTVVPISFFKKTRPLISTSLASKKPIEVRIGDEIKVVYKSGDSFFLAERRCHHRGFCLKNSTLQTDGQLLCPYHGKLNQPLTKLTPAFGALWVTETKRGFPLKFLMSTFSAEIILSPSTPRFTWFWITLTKAPTPLTFTVSSDQVHQKNTRFVSDGRLKRISWKLTMKALKGKIYFFMDLIGSVS
ncbi:MAG: Rieske 2Fe-2S domain-containing protein [Bdellovibrionales bacterium]|nr:Rieske 2Fe-2S domain-containing protein [Bdellovibrionales bacterium]